MKRIFFVSIKHKGYKPEETPFERLYEGVGKNTGNLLFTNAVLRQIRYDEYSTGFFLDPNKINEQYDAVVIPAANWCYENSDFTFLAEKIEALTIPVIIIGLGAQSGIEKRIPKISEGTLRLIRAISERSKSMGVRGEFTAEVLESYGFKNVRVIGCPSLYWPNFPKSIIPAKKQPEKIMVAGTRFLAPNLSQHGPDFLQQPIYRLAFQKKYSILFQSEKPEMHSILWGEEAFQPWGEALTAYYGSNSQKELYDYLRSYGFSFFDVDEWFESISTYDYFFGTRLHGTIAALIAGTPACLVAHDSRTQELADFAGFQTVGLDQIQHLSERSIRKYYEEFDFSTTRRKLEIAKKNYSDFLKENGLQEK